MKFTAFFFCAASLAFAQTSPSNEAKPADAPAPTEIVDDSSVTSQVASFAVTKLKDSPAVVTVISSDEIKENGARDLIDILSLVPGMFTGIDTQGIVGPGFRGLWGHEGKILLMIDGKEMNELLYSTMQLGNEFPVDLIERVEVVRGPGSVIYGGNAELSVINIVTRGVQGGTDLFVSGNYGQFTDNLDGKGTFASSYARRGGVLSGRYVFENIPGLSAFVSAGYEQGQRSVRTYTDIDDKTVSLRGQSALDPLVVQAGVGFRDIQGTFLYHRYNTNSVTAFGQGQDTPASANFESFNGELTGTFRPTNRIEIIPRLNATVQRPWSETDQASDFYYDKTARRLRARLIGRWAPIDELQITLGGDAMFDHGSLNGPADIGLQTSFAGTNTVDYRTFAGFVELFSENPIVNVAAGARYDNNSGAGDALVPRVVLLRSLGPVGLKALFSLAFRWPGVENFNLGTDLKPERTTVFEFEAGWDITKALRISANGYSIGINAPIAYTFDEATQTEGYLNLGKQGTAGLEVGLRYKTKRLRIDGNYSFYAPTQTENVDAYLAPKNPLGGARTDMFLGAPSHKAVVTASARVTDWLSLAPTVVVMGQRLGLGVPDVDGNNTTLVQPTQVLANLTVRVDNLPLKGLSASLGIYNIFATDFRFVQPYVNSHLPLPGLDREVLLKVSYLFEPTYE